MFDWCFVFKGNELKLEIILVDVDGELVCNVVGNLVIYLMFVDVIFFVEDG